MSMASYHEPVQKHVSKGLQVRAAVGLNCMCILLPPVQDSAAHVKGQEIISQEVLAFVKRGVTVRVSATTVAPFTHVLPG